MKVALLVLAACGSTETSVDGENLYANLCAPCHGPEGRPNEQMIATLKVKDLTAPELRARITPTLVEVQIRMGSPNKMMPPFAGRLSDESIKAIAAFVADPKFLAPRAARP